MNDNIASRSVKNISGSAQNIAERRGSDWLGRPNRGFDFELHSADGSIRQSSQLEGRVVVGYVWQGHHYEGRDGKIHDGLLETRTLHDQTTNSLVSSRRNRKRRIRNGQTWTGTVGAGTMHESFETRGNGLLRVCDFLISTDDSASDTPVEMAGTRWQGRLVEGNKYQFEGELVDGVILCGRATNVTIPAQPGHTNLIVRAKFSIPGFWLMLGAILLIAFLAITAFFLLKAFEANAWPW